MRRLLRIVAVPVGLVALTVTLYAAASYPSATKSFSTHLAGQVIASADINAIQDEIVAIENGLRTGIAHDFLPDGDITRAFGSAAKRWLHPSGTNAAPGVAVGATGVGVYSSGANALDFTTSGTKALGIDSTQFIDSPTQPRASAFYSTTQSINTGVSTAATLDSEDYDVGTMHDNAINNSHVTVPTGGDGLYLAIGQVQFAANAAGFRQVRLKKSNTTDLASVVSPVSTAANATEIQISVVVVLAAADYLEMIATQNSGGNLNIGSATASDANRLILVKLW